MEDPGTTAPRRPSRVVAAGIIITILAGRVAVIAAFAFLIWQRSWQWATAFVVAWGIAFAIGRVRGGPIGGTLWTFDDLARVTMASATVYAFFSTHVAALIFIAASFVYLTGLWVAQVIQSRAVHPEDAGYDPQEAATIREHALFFLVPRQSVRFARTCYVASRSGVVWIPVLLLQGSWWWPYWVVLYVGAGALSHILDPAPLIRAALKDSPHDMALRKQAVTLERIIDKIVGRRNKTRG